MSNIVFNPLVPHASFNSHSLGSTLFEAAKSLWDSIASIFTRTVASSPAASPMQVKKPPQPEHLKDLETRLKSETFKNEDFSSEELVSIIKNDNLLNYVIKNKHRQGIFRELLGPKNEKALELFREKEKMWLKDPVSKVPNDSFSSDELMLIMTDGDLFDAVYENPARWGIFSELSKPGNEEALTTLKDTRDTEFDVDNYNNSGVNRIIDGVLNPLSSSFSSSFSSSESFT